MLKKVLALVLAGAMVIGSLSLTAFATEMVNQSTDQQIKVTGLASGDTVDFYQILKWNSTDSDKTKTYAGWGLVDALSGIGTEFGYTNDAALVKEMIGDPAGNPAVLMKLSSVIAGKLADKYNSLVAKAGTISNNEATLTIKSTDTTELGLYMALITPGDANTVYNPVFVSADFNVTNSSQLWTITSASSYSDTGAAKKSTVTIDKKAAKDNGTSYDQDWKSTRIGEKVNYTVDTIIPGYGKVHTTPHFVVKDQMKALKLDANTVTLVAPSGLTKGTGTVSETDENADYFIEETTTGYTVTFTQKYLKTVVAPTAVQITYTATVDTSAPLSVNEEENEVWVEYSHDPTKENDYDYKKDDTEHYTFTIDANVLGGGESATGKSGSEIVKVGVDASGNPVTSTTSTYSWDSSATKWQSPLAGALFTLYKEDGTTVYTAVDGTEYKDIPSKADGRITLTGLDAGKYVLKETQAPNGFIKDTTAVNIEIKPYYTTKKVKMYTDGNTWQYTKSGNFTDEAEYEVEVLSKYEVIVNGSTTTHTFYNDGGKSLNWIEASSNEVPSSIVNTQGVELPSTGGIGTTLFYAGGAVLVLLAGVLLVSKRRIA